jgi:predicted CoA-substrate-specific enzyme activase
MRTAGIDIGSTTTKAVIIDEKNILGSVVISTSSLPADSAREVLQECLQKVNLNQDDLAAIVTTGYGRHLANFGDLVITEIKACKNGAVYIIKKTRQGASTLIDVGGQDTKVINLNADGDIEDFSMNDKCAAGTGRFLEMLANKLGMEYDAFVELALQSDTQIHMNSTCAVFAESEVVSLLAKGVSKADIAAAAHNAIAGRIGSMVRRSGGAEHKHVFFAGGGARNQSLVRAVESALGKKIIILENPQTIVALGAAVEAQRRLAKRI